MAVHTASSAAVVVCAFANAEFVEVFIATVIEGGESPGREMSSIEVDATFTALASVR